MKNRKAIRIITLILSVLLLIGAAVGISVAAESAQPTVEIYKKNLSYDSSLQIVYAIDADNADGYTATLLFADEVFEAPANINDGGFDYSKVQTKAENVISIGGNEYPLIFSAGINAKEMRKAVYALPVLVDADGNVAASGAIVSFSPYDYAMARFDGAVTEPQLALYTALLDYGAAVQAVLCVDENGELDEQAIIDAGGWADAYYNVTTQVAVDGTVVEGSAVTENARPNADGEYRIEADKEYENNLFEGFYTGDTQVYEHGEADTADGWSEYVAAPGNKTYTLNYKTGLYAGAMKDYNTDPGDVTSIDGLYGLSVADPRVPASTTVTNEDSTYYTYNSSSYATITDGYLELGRNSIITDSTDAANPVGSSLGKAVTTNRTVFDPENGDTSTLNVIKHVFETDFWLDSAQESGEETVAQWRIAPEGAPSGKNYWGITLYADNDSGQVYFVVNSGTGGSGDKAHVAGLKGTSLLGMEMHENEWNNLRIEYIDEAHGTDTFTIKVYVNGILSYTTSSHSYTTSLRGNQGDRDFCFTSSFLSTSLYSTIRLDNTFMYSEYDNDHGVYNNMSGTLTYDDEENGYLSYSNASSQAIAAGNLAANIDGDELIVVEMDMRWNGVTQNASSTPSWVFTPQIFGWVEGATASKNLIGESTSRPWFHSVANSDYDGLYLTTNSSSLVASDGTLQNLGNIVFSMDKGEWYTIRVEISQTPTVTDGVTTYAHAYSIYINDILVRDSINMNKLGTSEKIVKIDKIFFQLRGSGISFDIDNLYFAAVGNDTTLASGGKYPTTSDFNYSADYTESDLEIDIHDNSDGTPTLTLGGSSADGSWASVVTDGDNSVLEVGKIAGKGGVVKLLNNEDTTGSRYVLETGFKYSGGYLSGGSDAWLFKWALTGADGYTGSNAYILPIFGYADGNNIYLTVGFGSSKQVIATLAFGLWYTITIEYTPLGNAEEGYSGAYEIFVNGESCLTGVYSGTSSVDNTAYTGAFMELRTAASVDETIRFEDLSIGVADTIAKGIGKYANAAGVLNYDTVAEDGSVVDGVYSETKGANTAYTASANGVNSEYGEVYVFDVDFRWTDIGDAPSSDPYWFMIMKLLTTSGSQLGSDNPGRQYLLYDKEYDADRIYMSAASAALYGSDGELSSKVYTSFERGVWYNIRMEWYQELNSDGTTYTRSGKVYVNGELVNSFTDGTNRTAMLYAGSLQVATRGGGVSYDLDNVYVGVAE